jgi:protein ImuA
MSSAPSTVLQSLAQRIHEMEAQANGRRRPSFSLGSAALDGLLPDGRLPAGSAVELLSAGEGTGAWTLALLMAKHACRGRKVLVVVDGQRGFYPPAVAQWGIDLEQSIVVHPRNRREALLATNLSLRCSAVGAVVGYYDQLRTLDARKLQLAAEAGGGVGFLLRPQGALRVPSFAQLRLLIGPVASREAARRLRVEVVRCRGGKSGQSVQLEVSDETGDVRLLPEVASPATAARADGTAG